MSLPKLRFLRRFSQFLIISLVLFLVLRPFLNRYNSCPHGSAGEWGSICGLDSTSARSNFDGKKYAPTTSLDSSRSSGFSCDRLCHDKDENSLQKCLTRYSGGKHVWVLNDPKHPHREVVIKRAEEIPEELPGDFFRELDSFSDTESNLNVAGVIESQLSRDLSAVKDSIRLILSSFDQLVASSLKIRFSPAIEFNEKEDLSSVSAVFGDGDFIDDLKSDFSRLSIRSRLNTLWQLLQQEEFITLAAMSKHSKFVPPVLGFCGHYYVVRKYTTFDELASLPSSRSSRAPRISSLDDYRLNAILSLLRLLEELQNSFSETFNLCDMKLSNFGFYFDYLSDGTTYLNAVLIDADSVVFDTQLTGIFIPPLDEKANVENKIGKNRNSKTCLNDNDCAFFDCLGSCDLSTKRCSPERRDSNVAALCRKILAPSFSVLQSLYGSLLSYLFSGNVDFGFPLLRASDFNNGGNWGKYSSALHDCISTTWWLDCAKNGSQKYCSNLMIKRLRISLT